MAIGPAPFLLLEVLPELFIPLSPVPEEYTLVFLLLIPLSFAVSFVRYHLLDIRVVIHRTTLYGIVLGAFLLLYLATVAVAGAMIGQFTVGVSAVSAVIVALAFEPMRRTLQRLVDRRFFRIRYDFRQAQREFEVELKKRSSEADLARFVVTQVQSLIPVVRIAFVTAPDPAEQPGCLAEISDGRTDGGAEVLGRIWKNLLEDKPYGIPEEIEPGVPCLHLDSGLMDPSGFVVVFPMFSAKSGLLAFLALGRKKSEVRFSSEDIDLLLSIARQVGLEIERIRLQQEVFHKEVEAQRLRDLSELKSNFVSNVSHEFRTPLTSIRLFAELLQNKPAANDKKAREFLAIIEGEAERLDQMVTTILDSSRIERGIRTFSMQECDLRRLVRSVLRTMRYQIRKAGFTVRTVGLSAGKGSIVHGDAQAIIEILGNLIGNAVKYSGSPGVITVGIGRAAKWVTCSVRDRGKGIAPEALGHIFEPYYRAPGSEKKAEGIGLGLPLVKSIMEAHGGKVTAESVVGKGSCFTLYFPRSRVSRRRQERAAN
jgi:signal transduction histidine kinase